MEFTSKTEDVNDNKGAGCDSKLFVLWREVVMAYVAPATMAGIGGLVTGDRGLQIAALTTIGGTSALAVCMLGLWLRRRGVHKRWIISADRFVVVGLFVLAGASLGVLSAWVTLCLLGVVWPNDHLAWFNRVWFDFPLSATIASTIITWRWHNSVKKNDLSQGENRK